MEAGSPGLRVWVGRILLRWRPAIGAWIPRTSLISGHLSAEETELGVVSSWERGRVDFGGGELIG